MAESWWAYFGIPDWSDDATWSEASGNVNPAFPLVNLKTDQPRDRFQTNNISSSIFLEGDYGSLQQFNLISLLFTNCTSTFGKWKIRASNVSMGGTDVLETALRVIRPPAVDPVYDRFSSVWHTGMDSTDPTTSLYARYIQIEIQDSPTHPDGFFSIGRLFIGNLWRVPLRYGSALFGYVDEGASSTLRSGITTLSRGNPVPVFPFLIETQSRTDMLAYAYHIARLRGGTKSVLLLRDPDDDTYKNLTLQYGVLSGEVLAIENSFNYYTLRASIRGLL